MNETAPDYWDRTGLMMLIAGTLLPPFAWLLEMQISYAMVKWACENGARAALLAMPIGSLALIALGTWLSLASWLRLRGDASETGGPPIDRSLLLALSGLSLNALFGLLILTTYVARVVLSPCE